MRERLNMCDNGLLIADNIRLVMNDDIFIVILGLSGTKPLMREG